MGCHHVILVTRQGQVWEVEIVINWHLLVEIIAVALTTQLLSGKRNPQVCTSTPTYRVPI